jgi:hypothetical protein
LLAGLPNDGVLDPVRHRWIGVREDHTSEGGPVNTIVAIDLDRPGTSPGSVLVEGHAFFGSARLSPDANRMLWLAWDHPNMPWNGTTLYLAKIGADGTPAAPKSSPAAWPNPSSSPSGHRTGARSSSYPISPDSGISTPTNWRLGQPGRLCPMEAEFGVPQWNFGMSTFAFAGARRIICAYVKRGLGR